MLKLCCSDCGVVHLYDESLVCYTIDSVYVDCHNCGREINISCETVAPKQPITADLPPLPIGTLIIITINEHSWFDDIGIIRDKKFKHYRIEVHGQLIWMPEDWVKQNEPNDIN